MMREDYGTQLEDGSLRFVRDLKGPIERVWAYLVEPEKRAQWFCGGTTADRAGEEFTLAFRNADLNRGPVPERFAEDSEPVDMAAVLVEIDAPRLLVFRWTETDTRFELEEEGDRVRMTIVQSPPPKLSQRVGMAAGWHSHVGLLVDLLSDEPPRSLWPEFEEAKTHYDEAVR